jgi:hypothetical protein
MAPTAQPVVASPAEARPESVGGEASPNLRGYNVVVVHPRSGDVIERDVFDTFVARAESARLADFIPSSAGRLDRGGRHPGRSGSDS